MSFKTIQDVKKYILVEYGVSPISMTLNKDIESIDYKALNIKLNKSEIRIDKKVVDDMWTVKRK